MLGGSRPIVVRNRRFRWVFSAPKDRWGNSPRQGHLHVQEEGSPGKHLLVKLESKRWVSEEAHDGDIGTPHVASVLPSDVARVIEAALDSGWGSAEARTRSEPPELSDYRIVP